MHFFPEQNQTSQFQPLYSNRSVQLNTLTKRSQSYGKIRKNRPQNIGDLLEERERIIRSIRGNINQAFQANKASIKNEFNFNKKLATKLLELPSKTNDINTEPLQQLPDLIDDKGRDLENLNRQNFKQIKKRRIAQMAIINEIQYGIKNEENKIRNDVKQNVFLQTPKFSNLPINKILMESIRPDKNAVGKGREQFITAIIKQIHLEQNLRRLKHNVKLDAKEILKQILQQTYKMDPKMLSLDYEEYDPMFDPQNIKSVKILARQIQIANYQAQNHWKQNIYQQFESSFTTDIFERLNVNAYNGIISLSLFARGLNRMIQNDSFISSRDVYRIYHRIQPFTKSKFVEVLSAKNDKTFIR